MINCAQLFQKLKQTLHKVTPCSPPSKLRSGYEKCSINGESASFEKNFGKFRVQSKSTPNISQLPPGFLAGKLEKQKFKR